MELESQIRVVAQARQKAQEAGHNLRSAQAIWEIANHPLFEEAELAKIQCGESEQLLHELTLKAYRETGSKAPAVGVGIKEMTTYSYNAEEALAWAKEHGLCLKLDDTAFKKQVKISPLSFVTSKTEPQATIATEL